MHNNKRSDCCARALEEAAGVCRAAITCECGSFCECYGRSTIERIAKDIEALCAAPSPAAGATAITEDDQRIALELFERVFVAEIDIDGPPRDLRPGIGRRCAELVRELYPLRAPAPRGSAKIDLVCTRCGAEGRGPLDDVGRRCSRDPDAGEGRCDGLMADKRDDEVPTDDSPCIHGSLVCEPCAFDRGARASDELLAECERVLEHARERIDSDDEHVLGKIAAFLSRLRARNQQG